MFAKNVTQHGKVLPTSILYNPTVLRISIKSWSASKGIGFSFNLKPSESMGTE